MTALAGTMSSGQARLATENGFSMRAIHAFIVVLCLGVAWVDCAAQAADTASAARARPSAPQFEGPLLDVPVDRREYRLGAGDGLELGIYGSLNDHYSVVVTPEGSVVVPDIGVARVLGLNVDEAEAVLRAMVARLYRNVDVRLTLSRVRTFRVFVVGNVAQPGTRTANAATRVSELLPPVRSGGVVPRNIVLRRATGDSVRLDLLPFFQYGDLRANPTLREGDAVVVPVVDATVEVVGRVAYPGTYEFREGETVAELLRAVNAGGAFPSGAADSVWLVRFDATGQREEIRLSVGEVLRSTLRTQPFDAVFVAEMSNFRRQRTATVTGEVARPGVYPIRPDTTSVRDLVAMAGGFTETASLVSATLRRHPSPTAPRRRSVEGAVSDTLLSGREQQVLALMDASHSHTFVVIDFVELFGAGGDALDQRLQDGDFLTVPRHRNEVVVQGAVLRPGIVPYVEGADYRDYVQRAGGLSRSADLGGATIVRTGHGNMVLATDVHYPQPGDHLIVPFRTRRSLGERLASVNAVIGLVSSAILTLAVINQF
jgi:polysaccharide biosynthesis/export protein